MPPKTLPVRTRADLFAQLAALEKAGLPSDKAWGLLDLPSVPAARLQAVRNAISRGSNPAVVAQQVRLFTPMEASLVGAALLAGSPAQAYQRLAESCAQRAQNEGKLHSRLVLPAATLLLALLIHPLPQLIEGALSVGEYVVQVLKPLLVIATVFALAQSLLSSPSPSRWLLRVPLYGAALARKDAIHFFESLALLLEAGVPMFDALPTAVSTIESAAIRAAYARIKPCMQRGVPLSNALAEEITEPLFLGSAEVVEYIATGEASGTLPQMLLRHVGSETEKLQRFWKELADWLPRIAYTGVACWVAYGLLTGAGVGPGVLAVP